MIVGEHLHKNEFALKFDGGFASEHMLPARDLSEALDGVEKIVSSFLAALERNDLSERRLKNPSYQVLVRAPAEGSMDLVFMVQQLAAAAMPIYPFLSDAVLTGVSEHLLNSVLLFFGRRKKEADNHMDKALEMIDAASIRYHEDRQAERASKSEDAKAAREIETADRQRERENTLATLKELLVHQREVLEVFAQKAVYPVGRSCETLELPDPSGGTVTIDGVTANAIRGDSAMSGPRFDQSLTTITVKLDGLRRSFRLMWGATLDAPNSPFPIQIHDPNYDPSDPDSVYDKALTSRAPITITGKTQRGLDGEIQKFWAFDASIDGN